MKKYTGHLQRARQLVKEGSSTKANVHINCATQIMKAFGAPKPAPDYIILSDGESEVSSFSPSHTTSTAYELLQQHQPVTSTPTPTSAPLPKKPKKEEVIDLIDPIDRTDLRVEDRTGNTSTSAPPPKKPKKEEVIDLIDLTDHTDLRVEDRTGKGKAKQVEMQGAQEPAIAFVSGGIPNKNELELHKDLSKSYSGGVVFVNPRRTNYKALSEYDVIVMMRGPYRYSSTLPQHEVKELQQLESEGKHILPSTKTLLYFGDKRNYMQKMHDYLSSLKLPFIDSLFVSLNMSSTGRTHKLLLHDLNKEQVTEITSLVQQQRFIIKEPWSADSRSVQTFENGMVEEAAREIVKRLTLPQQPAEYVIVQKYAQFNELRYVCIDREVVAKVYTMHKDIRVNSDLTWDLMDKPHLIPSHVDSCVKAVVNHVFEMFEDLIAFRIDVAFTDAVLSEGSEAIDSIGNFLGVNEIEICPNFFVEHVDVLDRLHNAINKRISPK